MTTKGPFRSRGAIAIGCLCAAGTAYTMFEDVLRHGGAITTDHVMTAVVLVVTIGAGHFIWPAVCKFQVPAVLGFLVLIAAGTSICVASSAGRSDEHIKGRAAEAKKVNEGRALVEEELRKARADRQTLASRFATECASGSWRPGRYVWRSEGERGREGGLAVIKVSSQAPTCG